MSSGEREERGKKKEPGRWLCDELEERSKHQEGGGNKPDIGF